ncbi:unnamed protein product [Adineta steineri]|uniref:NHL repeat containing protein-like protein n=1 Tax=Adineta steineri TaxID=433720 RepID=A0A819XHH6_9BILA|nr:unnamed protein product [Adineta steineri]CAF4141167.1 unnamed protein product [Adineta steineri]
MLLYSFVQIRGIQISPCAKWDREGITLLGTGIAGNSSEELNEPIGISFYEPTNSLYIADYKNARIQMILLNESSGNAVTVVTHLFFPRHIYVDNDNDQPTIYVTLSAQNRVEKWISRASKGLQIGNECQKCVGIALDKDKNVYICDTTREQILKWSPLTNETSIRAGVTDHDGKEPNLLSTPQGIYVTKTGDDIYIADTGNSRIQRWSKDAVQGITVAGSSNGIAGNDSASLRNPIGVFVDETTNVIYIADTYNNQIKRWLPNAIHGDVIAGIGGQGIGPDELNVPTDLAFDSNGNLLVSDFKNNRIQLFRLIDNTLCSTSDRNTIHRMILSLLTLWIIVKFM